MRRLRSLPGLGRLVEAVRSSYRRKLLVALFTALLVVAAATAGLYVQLGALLGENVERSMTAAAQSEADEIEEWTSQNRLVARLLAEHPVYDSGNDGAVRAFLQSQRTNRQETNIENAYVVDRRNLTVKLSAKQRLEGESLETLPWSHRFAFRSYDDVQITRPFETANGTTVVGFLTPIRRMTGHVLVVTVDATSVSQRFEHPVEGGFTRVVDSNGTVVFADEGGATLEQYHPQTLRTAVVSRALNGESGFESSPQYEQSRSDDRKFVAAYAPVAGTDWVVVEHAPERTAYAITRQARIWIGVGGVVALAGLLATVAVVGADVRNAVSMVSRRAERIADGEYDVSFETDRADEFADLNQTLATTRDRLQDQLTAVRETRDELAAVNTELEERSAMVGVLNRVLRHNVRNDVNKVAGRIEVVADQIEDEALREHLDAAHETAYGLAEISDRTQRIQSLLAEEHTAPEPLAVGGALSDAVSGIETAHDNRGVDVDVQAGDDPVGIAAPTFPAAFCDVVEQMLADGDAAGTVPVVVSREDGSEETVVITVTDTVDGLSDMAVAAIEDGEETPLRHAKGLALWCLAWTVSYSGGELAFDGADGFTVRLPAAIEPAAKE